MDPQILQKVTDHFSKSAVKYYAKGEIITHARQAPDGVSFLLDGVVEQYDITPEGNRLTVNIFKPPAFFPMSWAINKTPNEYFFGALTDVKLRQADAGQTIAFLRANPDVTLDLLSRVYRGTDGLLKRLMLAASGIAASRLVFELLLEAYRFGTATTDGRRLIKIRQHTLAARSGLARETISRELHKLAGEQLIALTRQGIAIDTAALEQKLALTI
jgi:CRP-like cAMP-binding protein